MVYFMRRGPRGPIKIGFSCQPEKRCAQVQRQLASGPYVALAALMPGDIGVEGVLHRRFAEGALGHEWFDCETLGLRRFVSAALHFEGHWPDFDKESPLIHEVLAVLVEADYPVPHVGIMDGWA